MFNQIWQRRGSSSFGYHSTNHMELTLVTPPAAEPVSLSQLKQHARIPYDDADQMLSLYLVEAREKVEKYLRRALITQTWDLTLDWGPAWIELPKPPLQTIVGVFTTDLTNTEYPVPNTTYIVNTPTNFVGLNIGNVWPLHRGKAGFRIRYTCGYGDTAASVPATIREAILALASQTNDNRGQLDLPDATKNVLRSYRIEGQPYRMAKGTSREDLLA